MPTLLSAIESVHGVKMREFATIRPDVTRAAALLAVALTLTGCQAGETSVLPPRSSAPIVSLESSPTPSRTRPHDKIVEAYVEYWKVLAEAGRSSPVQARKLLKPYAKGPYLDHLVDGVQRMVDQGREPYGQMIPRVKQVKVGGKYAEVMDCQDMSKAAMADRRTHQMIPETAKGNAAADITATLQRSSDGRWRLTGLSIKGATCTPPSQ